MVLTPCNVTVRCISIYMILLLLSVKPLSMDEANQLVKNLEDDSGGGHSNSSSLSEESERKGE